MISQDNINDDKTQEQSHSITIRFPNTEYTEMKVPLRNKETVSDVKIMIQKYSKIPVDQIVLRCNTEIIQDSTVISKQYEDKDWDCLFVPEIDEKSKENYYNNNSTENKYSRSVEFLEKLNYSRNSIVNALKSSNGDLNKAIQLLSAKPVSPPVSPENSADEAPTIIDSSSSSPKRITNHRQYIDGSESSEDEQEKSKKSKDEKYNPEQNTNTKPNKQGKLSHKSKRQDSNEKINTQIDEEKKSQLNNRLLLAAQDIISPSNTNTVKTETDENSNDEDILDKATNPPLLQHSSAVKNVSYAIIDVENHKTTDFVQGVITIQKQGAITKTRNFLVNSLYITKPEFSLILKIRQQPGLRDKILNEKSKIIRDLVLLNRLQITFIKLVGLIKGCDCHPEEVFKRISENWEHITTDELKMIIKIREDPSILPPKLQGFNVENDPVDVVDSQFPIGNDIKSKFCAIIDTKNINMNELMKATHKFDQSIAYKTWSGFINDSQYITQHELEEIMEIRKHPETLPEELVQMISVSSGNTQNLIVLDRTEHSAADIVKRIRSANGSADSIYHTVFNDVPRISANELRVILHKRKDEVTTQFDTPEEQNPQPLMKTRKTAKTSYKNIISSENSDSENDSSFKDSPSGSASSGSASSAESDGDAEENVQNQIHITTRRQSAAQAKQLESESSSSDDDDSGNFKDPSFSTKTKTKRGSSKMRTRKSDNAKHKEQQLKRSHTPIKVTSEYSEDEQQESKEQTENKQEQEIAKPHVDYSQKEVEDFTQRLRELVVTKEIAEDLMQRSNNNPGWAMVSFLFEISQKAGKKV
ncbi:hypothetical protein TVAG_230200 [Trichomonas vaginalis G3]|uniref:UBA/TS-N domain containing protein n=1 Tax=Trichomonas vaginalis (strain ATCC PRA-98 / G3) TaxID=412133 RepID=A2F108_TRIV3|nr:ubiquitin-like family [Trichomonas vaginalis G3]EAY01416.1 hypothetical protein TVAG_230200 [Trichomonas vaginalis G3]KAI5529514.1 ubiquitin-like family [Trichomonas vaginalis G3]|eukprot:XP_001330251.1 hypothetical protein [Trichomonas vaginalis G3]